MRCELSSVPPSVRYPRGSRSVLALARASASCSLVPDLADGVLELAGGRLDRLLEPATDAGHLLTVLPARNLFTLQGVADEHERRRPQSDEDAQALGVGGIVLVAPGPRNYASADRGESRQVRSVAGNAETVQPFGDHCWSPMNWAFDSASSADVPPDGFARAGLADEHDQDHGDADHDVWQPNPELLVGEPEQEWRQR